MEEFRSQKTSAEGWSTNFATVSICKTSLTECEKPVDQSLESFKFGGNLFSSLCGVLDVKKYFCHMADKASILIGI